MIVFLSAEFLAFFPIYMDRENKAALIIISFNGQDTMEFQFLNESLNVPSAILPFWILKSQKNNSSRCKTHCQRGPMG